MPLLPARLYPAVWGVLLSFATVAYAQPTSCRTAPAAYDGPCYYDALPALFDDFLYTSDAFPAPGSNSGSVYALNEWYLRDRTDQAHGWYRFNRDNLPTAGAVRFDDSVMHMEIPAGTPAEAYPRSTILLSTFEMGEGTYHWRVRLSDHWTGQRIRQSIWAISPTTWFFTERSLGDSTRYIYWSELDFENENHFQGEWRSGTFYPDYVTRMSVTNHVGHQMDSEGNRQRLSHPGPVTWHDGTGALVRNGFARKEASREAPLVEGWSDTWWSLMIHVDDAAQTVTYRMSPESNQDKYEAVWERTVSFGESFYPRDAMAAAFSLHWITPEGRLKGDLALSVDWFFHSPVVGLTDGEVRTQIAAFRDRQLPRVNTTGASFEDRSPQNASLRILGPEVAACEEVTRWRLDVEQGGAIYQSTFRYREEYRDGRIGAWRPVYQPTVELTPARDVAALLLDAQARDLWKPNPPLKAESGWLTAPPDNYTTEAERRIEVICP